MPYVKTVFLVFLLAAQRDYVDTMEFDATGRRIIVVAGSVLAVLLAISLLSIDAPG